MEILGVRLSMRASRYAIQTGMWQVSKNTVPKQNTRQFISDKEVIRLHKNIGTSIWRGKRKLSGRIRLEARGFELYHNDSPYCYHFTH